MKKKEGFALRTVCGEHIIVAEGSTNIDFSKVISLNDSAAYLWSNIGDGDFTAFDMATLLTKEYDVSPDTALQDSEETAKKWIEAGIVAR